MNSDINTIFTQIISESSTTTTMNRLEATESASVRVPEATDENNPLNQLPFDVQDSITTEFYETGRSSMMQKYIEDSMVNYPNHMQKLFNDLYHYAVRLDRHILAWNVLVVLSQIPYAKLGSWADMLAMAATRNHYLDIQEMGIRCFENWEDINAYSFLEKCSFSEEWLQEYANEVCMYLREERLTANVLPQENYSWQVARRTIDSSSNTERYSSGHSSSRIQDRQEQVICMESGN